MSDELYTAQRIRMLQQLNPSGRYFDMLVAEKVQQITNSLCSEVEALETEAACLDRTLVQVNAQMVSVSVPADVASDILQPENAINLMRSSNRASCRFEITIPNKFRVAKPRNFSQQCPERQPTAEQLAELVEQVNHTESYAREYNHLVVKLNTRIDEALHDNIARFQVLETEFISENKGRLRTAAVREERACELFSDVPFGSVDYANSYDGAVEMLREVLHEIKRFAARTK